MPHVHADKMQMFEYVNLNWDTFTDEGVDPVIINTYYEALATIEDVKAYYIIVQQTNNGVAVEDLEVELTVNGVVFTDVLGGIASGTPRYMIFDEDGALTFQVNMRQVLAIDPDQSAPLETRDLRIRIRQTSVVDVVSAILEVNMIGATKEYS